MGLAIPHNLADLPVEVLDLIFDRIPRPTDLKALCLVSKGISGPAFRQLYRDVVLPFAVVNRGRAHLDRLSQSHHLHHTQSLDVGSSSDYCSHGFCTNLHSLLQNLPLNTLKRFTYGLVGRPSAEDLITLWRGQKALRNLQLDFNLFAPSIREIVKDLKDDLRSLTSVEELDVNLGGDEVFLDIDIPMNVKLFESLYVEKLRSITLRFAGFEIYSLNSLASRNYEFAPAGPIIVATQFPQTLMHVSLSFVNLPTPDKWKLGEYHQLSSLELYECGGVVAVLDSVQQPKLKHFSIQRKVRDASMQFQAVKRFLRRFRTLESFSIATKHIAYGRDRLGPVISAHGQQLRSLRIEGYTEVGNPSHLVRSLQSCPKLEYLALPIAVEAMTDQCKEILQHLPNLELLICYQAKMTDDDVADWQHEHQRTAIPQQTADAVFSSMPANSKLKVLVFEKPLGTSAGNLFCSVDQNLSLAWCYCYVQRRNLSTFDGRDAVDDGLQDGELEASSSAAVAFDPQLVKYLFPGARILQQDAGLPS